MTASLYKCAERNQNMEFYQLISSLYAVRDILMTKIGNVREKENKRI